MFVVQVFNEKHESLMIWFLVRVGLSIIAFFHLFGYQIFILFLIQKLKSLEASLYSLNACCLILKHTAKDNR